jgi:hypothetical protein
MQLRHPRAHGPHFAFEPIDAQQVLQQDGHSEDVQVKVAPSVSVVTRVSSATVTVPPASAHATSVD